MSEKRIDTLYVILAVIASFGLGVIVNDKPQEIITEIQTIEVPVIITETETRVEVIEIPVTEIITINHTTIHEILVPTPIPLRDYPTKQTLLDFIKYDNTNTYEYSTTRWTCMDYTMRVIKNAEALGYRVTFVFREDDNHAVCMAYCEEEAIYYAWEPQTDAKLWTWQSTEAG